jgi:NADPH-dependent 2,4-dienoyl-CoA reductase/sulfur reductase-like enzyme
MTQNVKTNVLVVVGGPVGYVAAIRAGQLGFDTVLVEVTGWAASASSAAAKSKADWKALRLGFLRGT